MSVLFIHNISWISWFCRCWLCASYPDTSRWVSGLFLSWFFHHLISWYPGRKQFLDLSQNIYIGRLFRLHVKWRGLTCCELSLVALLVPRPFHYFVIIKFQYTSHLLFQSFIREPNILKSMVTRLGRDIINVKSNLCISMLRCKWTRWYFAKPLPLSSFAKIIIKIGLHNIHSDPIFRGSIKTTWEYKDNMTNKNKDGSVIEDK